MPLRENGGGARHAPNEAVDIEPTGAEQVREHEHGVPDLVRLRRLEHVVVVAGTRRVGTFMDWLWPLVADPCVNPWIKNVQI